ncbi:MAG: DUF1801 domain-containing protein [Candidatus Eisenbacteria bacterium]|uniref:DUF1801 domain-containing protein n=1 Tax=Eiseniibacteriota bacterium TaxID=2212470 RepID=A0A956M301_UNCEI|nr:DUF1801 domain-containing protein [Candidatus Eisenbacteria bacterium]
MTRTAVESEIGKFVDAYAPEIAASLRTCRRKVRRLFPRGYELVYDNYNALVFGFSATDRASEAILSIAGYPRWVTLFFLRGAALDDPDGLLEGSGRQVRSIRLATPGDLDKPAVRALVARAIAADAEALASAPRLATIVKSVSAKQRPRRPPEPAKKRPGGSGKRT